jgi:hypothetical protein
MFDQPLTAALRTGQWENTLSVLHPEGIKTHFGLHHLAPPRTNSAVYKARQVGETLLIQQEQVDEDKSRLNAKTTNLYYMLGRMTGYPDLNETVAIFWDDERHHRFRFREPTNFVERNRKIRQDPQKSRRQTVV